MADEDQGPTGMTYNTLIAQLRRYVERGGDLDEAVEAELPVLVNNVERDLAVRFKIQGYLAPYISRMQTSEPRIAKPQNWRSTVSINYGAGPNFDRTTTLRARSYEYIRAIYPQRESHGPPRFYADYDKDHWLVLPVPNLDYPFEAMVWRLLPLLAPSNQTNFLTDEVPNLLLYTCLQGLEAYLKHDNRVALWGQLSDQRFSSMVEQDTKKMIDRSQMRTTA